MKNENKLALTLSKETLKDLRVRSSVRTGKPPAVAASAASDCYCRTQLYTCNSESCAAR